MQTLLPQWKRPSLRTLNYERAIVLKFKEVSTMRSLRTLNYERAIVLSFHPKDICICLRTLNYERAIVR